VVRKAAGLSQLLVRGRSIIDFHFSLSVTSVKNIGVLIPLRLLLSKTSDLRRTGQAINNLKRPPASVFFEEV
jgi:hypothetical protein